MNDIEAKKKKEIHLTELELLAPAAYLQNSDEKVIQ